MGSLPSSEEPARACTRVDMYARTLLWEGYSGALLPAGLDVNGECFCDALPAAGHICDIARDLHALCDAPVQLLQAAGQLVLYGRVLPGPCPTIHATWHATCMPSCIP